MPLLGVAPENEVIYPRINPQGRKDNELTNGHTHFFLIGETDEEGKDKNRRAKKFFWGEEAQMKLELAQRIAAGRSKKNGAPPCKIVTVLVGDNAISHKEAELSIEMGIPVVILEGSPLSCKCMNTQPL